MLIFTNSHVITITLKYLLLWACHQQAQDNNRIIIQTLVLQTVFSTRKSCCSNIRGKDVIYGLIAFIMLTGGFDSHLECVKIPPRTKVSSLASARENLKLLYSWRKIREVTIILRVVIVERRDREYVCTTQNPYPRFLLVERTHRKLKVGSKRTVLHF